MHLKSVILAVFITLLPGFGLGAQETLKIHVSVLPQKFFVEQIVQDLADVDVLVAPGKSPTTYSPTPDQIRRLARADVYFRIGVPFENGFLHRTSRWWIPEKESNSGIWKPIFMKKRIRTRQIPIYTVMSRMRHPMVKKSRIQVMALRTGKIPIPG